MGWIQSAKQVATVVLALAMVFEGASQLTAQTLPPASDPPYLNPSVPIDVRVHDLISRMTLDEKASQLVGLSYSKFAYKNVQLSSNSVQAGNELCVDAEVDNISQRDGDEVVELYLNFPKVVGAPIRALRGFTRVHVPAGGSQQLHLVLDPRALSYVNEAGDRIVGPGSYTISIGGGQPGTSAPSVEAAFTIAGQMKLPD
jgi:Fibronectin type III-like domain